MPGFLGVIVVFIDVPEGCLIPRTYLPKLAVKLLILIIVFLEFQLLSVHGFSQRIDAAIFVVEDNLYHFSRYATLGLRLLRGIVWLGGKVVPNFRGNTVSQAEQVYLSCIHNPVIVFSHPQERDVLALAFEVDRFYLVVSLVLIRRIGGTSSPFGFDQRDSRLCGIRKIQ